MRVLHWYPNFLGGGGVANAVLGLALAQAECGAEVAITSAEPEAEPLYQGVSEGIGKILLFRWSPVFALHAGGLHYRKVPLRVVRQVQEFRPDIVHIHGEFNPDNLQVPRLFSCPIVLSPHGAFHPVVLRKSKQAAKRFYMTVARHLLYRHLRAFHALCPAEAGHVRSAVGSVPVYTVPQGASPHVPENGNVPRGGAGPVTFAYVGRLNTFTKGLDILVEAFADAVGRAARELRLVLVGPDLNGSLKRLKRLASHRGCEDKIIFAGAVTGHQVAEFLSRSDIYIHLSRHEVFGLSVAEALLAKKPCILSREVGAGSYPEIGTLPHIVMIPPNKESASSAMLDFIGRIEELRKLAESSLERVQAFFDWRRAARIHLEWYERFIGGNT